MEIEEAEKMLEEVRKKKEEERIKNEKIRIEHEAWEKMKLRGKLELEPERKKKLYNMQKETLSFKIKKQYSYAIEQTEELWAEYWEMLLDEKINNIINFLEYKKMKPIKEKQNDTTN